VLCHYNLADPSRSHSGLRACYCTSSRSLGQSRLDLLSLSAVALEGKKESEGVRSARHPPPWHTTTCARTIGSPPRTHSSQPKRRRGQPHGPCACGSDMMRRHAPWNSCACLYVGQPRGRFPQLSLTHTHGMGVKGGRAWASTHPSSDSSASSNIANCQDVG
jgi:hypothetical protein